MPCASRSRNSGISAKVYRDDPTSPDGGPGRGISSEFEEICVFLDSVSAWQDRRPERCIETHSSLVWLTGDRAWKLKKPVLLGHIDLRSLAARAHFCREELRLNRELSGDVYRGLTPVVRHRDGALALGGNGRTVDWLIEMVRLPDESMLSHRLTSGPPPREEEVDALCTTLIRFYKGHMVSDTGASYYNRLSSVLEANADHLNAMRGELGDALRADVLAHAGTTLETCREEIEARGGPDGVLVEGHGDLRAEHVCLLIPPVIFDRLEFDRAYRVLDPYDEINALGLQCDLAGYGWIRAAALARLAGHVPRPSAAVLEVYGVLWCLTRARLAIDHLLDPVIRDPGKWAPQARHYLNAALALIETSGFSTKTHRPPANRAF